MPTEGGATLEEIKNWRVSSPRSQNPDFKTVDISIRDLGELAEMLRDKQHGPTGFDHSIALRLDQISQTLRSVEPSPRSAEAQALHKIAALQRYDRNASLASWKKRNKKSNYVTLNVPTVLLEEIDTLAALPGQPSTTLETDLNRKTFAFDLWRKAKDYNFNDWYEAYFIKVVGRL